MPFAREDFDSNLVSIGAVEAMLAVEVRMQAVAGRRGASAPGHTVVGGQSGQR